MKLKTRLFLSTLALSAASIIPITITSCSKAPDRIIDYSSDDKVLKWIKW